MSTSVGDWLPRAIVESALIVMSILLALGLDEWQEDQEIQELIDRSVGNFRNELRQNMNRIEDVSAYHKGVQQLLINRSMAQSSQSVSEFRSIMEAMQPIVLTSSAWDTAVATGALGRMDFELVSALTLTYNTQQRFDESFRGELRMLMAPTSLNDENLEVTTANATRFVTDISSREAELSVYYDQTLNMIEELHEFDDEQD